MLMMVVGCGQRIVGRLGAEHIYVDGIWGRDQERDAYAMEGDTTKLGAATDLHSLAESTPLKAKHLQKSPCAGQTDVYKC